jgi:hypothetical protein
MNLNPLLGDTSAARTLTMAGVRIRFLVSAEQSGGQWSFLEYTAPPGFPGPQPHLHSQTTELFYVLEGQLTVRLGERRKHSYTRRFCTRAARCGSWLLQPRHRTRALSDSDVAGGAEGYFTALSEMVQNAPSWPLPDMRPVTALAERFDIFAPPVKRTGEGGTGA